MANDYVGAYSEAYRHFDNIIWQVPTWGIAVSAGTIVAAVEMNSAPSIGTIAVIHAQFLVLLFGAALLGCLAMVVCKARVHQTSTLLGIALSPPFSYKMSAGKLLQAIICYVSAGLLWLSVTVVAPSKWSTVLCVAIAILFWRYVEGLHSGAKSEMEKAAGIAS